VEVPVAVNAPVVTPLTTRDLSAGLEKAFEGADLPSVERYPAVPALERQTGIRA
jgi:hypothetical protein